MNTSEIWTIRKRNALLAAGLLVALLTAVSAFSQSVQTVRGRVVDAVSQVPLAGVNVVVLNVGEVPLGASTDADGYYLISGVPVGRQTIKITYVGFEDQVIPNIVVTAGKEVILNIALTESVSSLDEVVVVANTREDKTATNNDLAVVSARSFNVDDTKRYAGALGDPSRMAANFAGVIGGDDSRNDIVVRGNSPQGMLWQLEGLNIPNPNHFGSLTSTGGPVSMLNNNNLDKSDFITSAFPAQYGNATAGVFDIRLRDGNNQQQEFVTQVGFNGFEIGAEGPFSKNSKASYIANYRYSTLGVFNALGIDFGTGSNVPLYQDLNFKISLPTKSGGKWTVFGLGGTSSIDLLGSEADLTSTTEDLYGTENLDSYPRYRTGIAGISYEKNVSARTFIKATAGVSHTYEEFTADSLVRDSEQNVVDQFKKSNAQFTTNKASLAFFTRTKFNARNSITSGFYIDATGFDLYNQDLYPNVGKDSVRLNVEDKAQLYQAYTTWKHRFNNRLTLAAGVHAQYYSLNEELAIGPRVSVQYRMHANHSLSLGYGRHSQAAGIYTTFVQTPSPAGPQLTNRDLGFVNSDHYVLTYDWNISEQLRLKAEGYYQQLRDVPVEQGPSSFSAINTGASFIPSDKANLVNNGTGTNTGVELTLERFFSRGYYFLATASVFDSKYKGSDGVERNTAYNTGQVVNLLAGKEWKLGSGSKFLSLNLKVTTIGGKYLTPIDFAKSQQYGSAIYRESEAFSEKQDDYFRTDFRVSYRKEYRKSTLELALDLQNVTNNQNIFAQSYNPRTNTIVTQYQQGFFPVPYVRFTF
ncbi:MAG: TonB-dependent receptor [Cyclobacteriaceae bacterium]|jgi:hypothetical protein